MTKEEKNDVLNFLSKAISINAHSIDYKDDFEIWIRRIRDYELNNKLSAKDCEDVIKEYCKQSECSTHSIKLFMENYHKLR